MAPPRRAEATVKLEAIPASILAFEDFVDGHGLPVTPRARPPTDSPAARYSTTSSSTPLRSIGAASSRGSIAAADSHILLGFYFRARGFAAFAGGDAANAAPEPLFDPAHRRWRGIGLVMCRNLASRVCFRPGERMDRIFLEFEPESDEDEED
jgi:hypothetical protein